MKTTRLITVALAAVLLFAGCRSSKHATRTDATTSATQQVVPPVSDTEVGRTGQSQTTGDKQTTEDKKSSKQEKQSSKEEKKNRKEEQTLTRQQKTNVDAMTAKMSLTLKAGSKKLTVGGSYRLKRNDVVQMNLTYQILFVSVNIGTLELTPDYILFLDRYHKRYCKVTYAEVPSLGEAGIDFNYLQSIFWGDAGASPTPLLSWEYSKWQPLGDGQFPGQIEFSMKASSTTYKATFNLSNISAEDGWSTRTTIGSNYTPMSFDSVMNLLMSVAK